LPWLNRFVFLIHSWLAVGALSAAFFTSKLNLMEKINWGVFALLVSLACLGGLLFAGVAHRRTQQEIWEIQSQNIQIQDDIRRLKYPPKPSSKPQRFDYIEPEMSR